MPTIHLNLPRDPYAIEIKSGLIAQLGQRLQPLVRSSQILLAVDANIASTHGEVAAKSLQNAGFEVQVHQLIADEKRKTLETVAAMYDVMRAAKFERSGGVVAMGGGIVGDVAGFAAATYMRGVPLVHVPTTLLAMVDASIGGKTGVNLPVSHSSLVKNLIGSFWQPQAVFIDPDVLTTLDDRHFQSGLAECVKHGMIADANLLDFLDKNTADILAKKPEPLTELIARSVQIKATIVQEDERETGRRALLNLGHTFGHALESITHLNVQHGEAVAIGLVAAMHCAVGTKRMTQADADRAEKLIIQFGLPVRVPAPVSMNAVFEAMAQDKKRTGGRQRLILPLGRGNAVIADDVPAEVVRSALAEIGVTDS